MHTPLSVPIKIISVSVTTREGTVGFLHTSTVRDLRCFRKHVCYQYVTSFPFLLRLFVPLTSVVLLYGCMYRPPRGRGDVAAVVELSCYTTCLLPSESVQTHQTSVNTVS
jgi:hypothetical protein